MLSAFAPNLMPNVATAILNQCFRQTRFSVAAPYDEIMLPVDTLHTLRVCRYGNPEGIPVVCLHGGPGGGFTPTMSGFFDPDAYNIIGFDQRGAGKSTPSGELRRNNTQALVQDIETIRKHFGVEQWVVFGGSWGSTLALCYASAYPERVLGLIMRGIFMGNPGDIDWYFGPMGVKNIYPEAWQMFTDGLELPPNEPARFYVKECRRRLAPVSPIETQRLTAGLWNGFEAAIDRRTVDFRAVDHAVQNGDVAGARIENHYYGRNCMKAQQLIQLGLPSIRANVPAVVVHSRHDCDCRFVNADWLKRLWPELELLVPGDGTNHMYETDPSAFPSRVDEMTKYLVAATCWMAANLRPFNKGPVTRMVQGTRLWLPG